MTSDARGHRGTGAQSGRTVEAALAAAIGFALAAGPAAAQRLPERFGLPAAVRWTPAGPRAALVQDTVRRGVSGAEIALGIAGSAAGMWGGALAGLAVFGGGRACSSGCSIGASGGCAYSCGDAAFGGGVIGLVAGSIVGTAVGTRLGAKLAHRRVGGFGRRLVAGGAGLLAGLAAFELASNLTGHDYNAPPLIAFPVAQGFVGALLGRAR
jgi:hypothetical protein